jgi:tyrosinase
MPLSYPSPHTVRRNFTLQPYKDVTVPLVTDPQKIGNSSFAAAVVEVVLGTSAGEYKGFQTALEAPEVRKMDMSSIGRDVSS